MEPWVLQVLASIFGGGLAGGALTIIYNWLTAKQKSNTQQRAAIASLLAELEYIRQLCDYDEKLRQDEVAPLIRFPTIMLLRVTFQERHLYPFLNSLQSELESLLIALIQINQRIDVRESLRVMPYVPGGNNPQALVDNMRNQICDFCAGKRNVEGKGSENLISLPSYVDAMLKKIKELNSNVNRE